PILTADLGVSPKQMARAGDRGPRREGQRCEHRPRRDRAIVGTVRHPTGHISEIPPVAATFTQLLIRRSVTGGNAPEVVAVTGECERIARAIFAMQRNRARGVLEIV